LIYYYDDIFNRSFIHHLSINSFTHSFSHLVLHSVIHSFIPSFLPCFLHSSLSLTHSIIYSVIHAFIHFYIIYAYPWSLASHLPMVYFQICLVSNLEWVSSHRCFVQMYIGVSLRKWIQSKQFVVYDHDTKLKNTVFRLAQSLMPLVSMT
jgi:hypothetical protein